MTDEGNRYKGAGTQRIGDLGRYGVHYCMCITLDVAMEGTVQYLNEKTTPIVERK